jgi:uncharacterized RDD family membrane protein YckC
MSKANPNKRVCEYIIDSLIAGLSIILLKTLIHRPETYPVFELLAFIFLVFRDSFSGRSPGKIITGLKVVDVNGNHISYSQSFKRNIILFWPE